MEGKSFLNSNGEKIYYNVWTPQKDCIAVLHINHGMAEHSKRYDEVAKYFNSLGIKVYAQDHRGHGLTGKEDQLGFFSEKDGWNLLVNDALEFSTLIHEENPKLPLFLMGHSMGSFVSRCLLQRNGAMYKAAIIMGTATNPGLIGKIGKAIASKRIKKYGPRYVDKKLDKLAFGTYNNKFDKNGSTFQWLSRDEEQVEKYEKDVFCGYVCTSSFYADLIDGIFEANNYEKSLQIPKNLPILLISGSNDPVGNFSKGVKKVEGLYKSVGIKDLELKFIEGGRHEILNEVDRTDTYKFLGEWLLKKL